MKATSSAPNAARGEVLLTVGGEQFPVRFGMNVMRDLTKMTGKAPSEFGEFLGQNYNEALTAILTCAVRRYVPGAVGVAEFSQDDAGDLIDAMPADETDAVAEAIAEAVGVGPFLRSLLAKVTAKNKADQTQEEAKAVALEVSK